ncbi:MAG: hypothetical protein KJ697_05270 [Nanoarchaeota archaeon]|nr:hypothetical protein [Nanoarchaeota archaeon]MBU4123895.1 hypothetical protein [Nanoarchaeota archaeon]
MVGGLKELKKELFNKTKLVAMLAPSFIVNFDYPEIITQLKDLGFDKTVELTFGAKIVNIEYHKLLQKNKGFLISSVCPGSVYTIIEKKPRYLANMIRVYSPMIVTAKICRKLYPKHKIVFISPCYFKSREATTTDDVDIVIGCNDLQRLFDVKHIKSRKVKGKISFDKFYNDYTKIYPLAGGLSKTAHVKGALNPGETKVIDGIVDILKFLDKPDKKVKFLDCNYCVGGCIGGPCLRRDLTLEEKKQRVLAYVKQALKTKIPKKDKGILEKAKGIKVKY